MHEVDFADARLLRDGSDLANHLVLVHGIEHQRAPLGQLVVDEHLHAVAVLRVGRRGRDGVLTEDRRVDDRRQHLEQRNLVLDREAVAELSDLVAAPHLDRHGLVVDRHRHAVDADVAQVLERRVKRLVHVLGQRRAVRCVPQAAHGHEVGRRGCEQLSRVAPRNIGLSHFALLTCPKGQLSHPPGWRGGRSSPGGG
ncbi:hypothetical protein Henu3_gp85 [Mycobacterium phage Henu3]|uniref:Uncharacterized protein n=1 Tax=Mycobacterium phage Henu3 TaxID=2492961 RepID=A0A410T7N8_9CAUD|nr:hypothetical protein I5G68_gp72 [Mycobacterium phage Henu3]QAU05017.1 hypothetical protein Henu3_gp85 [Mycobacterium phage Henu3]